MYLIEIYWVYFKYIISDERKNIKVFLLFFVIMCCYYLILNIYEWDSYFVKF